MIVAEFPHPKIEVACERCGRRGAYAKTRFDQDMRLPDLLAELTKDCPNSGPLVMLERCRALFPQLVKNRPEGRL